MIFYQHPKGFIFSLIDPALYLMGTLLSVYWARWEIEQNCGELKNSQINGQVRLRSRFPKGVG
ncbi:hypothetical protein CXF72_09090 [Psychromonas sp. MB-3u-54]|uniref:hypothetical protein n=1 Tax=Psychromonas sp. MB-3u-54 TaxID=2058319 RepID=UPI000C325A37|nr:hypothetical protein [Psychromonas sp. MB-3u-54]PKH02939.1 hypothetical protein CXF72_09090 [Psychromonas sp. MB-3u-54]